MGETFNYEYNIGETVGTFKVISKIKCKKTNNKLKSGYGYVKGYGVVCVVCGVECEKYESELKRGRGCGVCSGRVCKVGINDIATTHPHLVKYFANKEDAYRYTHRSGVKIKTKCPDCSTEKYMLIANLTSRGYSCVCTNHNSFPNKVITSILKQLNIDYECEKTFNWSAIGDSDYDCVNGIKLYDHYIKSLGILIENHGRQHYEETNRHEARTLEEEQSNDKLKRKLALSNGIKHYIELDCRKSEMEWIKQSVMSSELPNLLNFKEEDIDWDVCQEFANKSIVKEICDLWNGGIKSTSQIGNIVGIDSSNVSKHLKIGTKLGICDYEAKKSLRESVAKNGKKNAKRVAVYFKEDDCEVFNSAKDIESISNERFAIKMNSECIKRVCRGERDSYKGYIFKYVD